MKKALFILLLCLLCQNLSSQKKDQEYDIVTHQVKFGETVKTISKHYMANPSAIYKLNKGAVDGIEEGMVLYVPVPKKEETIAETPSEAIAEETVQTQSEIPAEVLPEPIVVQAKTENATESSQHRVQSGETLSGLAQQYNVSVKEIKAANPKVAKRGLRTDEVIYIPAGNLTETSASNAQVAISEQAAEPVSEESVSTDAETSGIIDHKVQKGETLSEISKKYNVSIAEIKDQNQRLLSHGLQAGQVIKIRKE